MRAILAMAATALAPAATPPVANAETVATAARAAMARTGAKGLAIAVIDDGRVASVQTFGARNAAGAPLTPRTIMYGASLTKTVFAWLVMQLVEEGRVDLDKPIATMLAKPLPEYGNSDRYGNWGDLSGDPRWRTITPRMVLTHSTGFANFADDEPDGKLRIRFDPGARYSYSGEGVMLLQFGLEQGLGLDVQAELERRLFAPLGMNDTSLIWRPAFAADLADGWKADGSVEPHDERSKVRAAGSMDTTIADLAKFAAALVRGYGLKRRAAMTAPLLPIRTASRFPNFQPDTAKPIPGLAAGLGVIAFNGPQGPGFYKGGHNDSTGNTMVCIERGRRCVLILANDVRAEAAFPGLVRTVLGDTGVPYAWEYPQLTATAAQPRS